MTEGWGAGAGDRSPGTARCFVEADAPPVACRVHGVTTAQVLWARHDARHTRGP
jgi:hypothetical protein